MLGELIRRSGGEWHFFLWKKKWLAYRKIIWKWKFSILKNYFSKFQDYFDSCSKLTAGLTQKNIFSLASRRQSNFRIPIGRHRTSKNNKSCITSRKLWCLSIIKRFSGVKETIKSHRLHIFGALGLAASALSRFLNILAFKKDLKNHGGWFKIVITRVWYKGFYSETEIFFLRSILQDLSKTTFKTSFEYVQLEMEAIEEMTITIKTQGSKNLESLF